MMLSFLGLDYEKTPIALPNQEQKSSEDLARHPLGKVPALEDGEVTVWDSQAILVYLSRQYDSSNTWLPADPVGQANVTQWLSFAAKEMWDGRLLQAANDIGQRVGEISVLSRTERMLGHHYTISKQ